MPATSPDAFFYGLSFKLSMIQEKKSMNQRNYWRKHLIFRCFLWQLRHKKHPAQSRWTKKKPKPQSLGYKSTKEGWRRQLETA
ncbi:MAG: hypothetical protein WAS93_05830 [Burkholderiaceae bacterium]